jgi:hypothetical protein
MFFFLFKKYSNIQQNGIRSHSPLLISQYHTYIINENFLKIMYIPRQCNVLFFSVNSINPFSWNFNNYSNKRTVAPKLWAVRSTETDFGWEKNRIISMLMYKKPLFAGKCLIPVTVGNTFLSMRKYTNLRLKKTLQIIQA